MQRASILFCLVLFVGVAGLCADEQDSLRVGVQSDGRILVPTNQVLKPAGKQITFPGRPVDLALTGDGRTLVVKSMRDLVFLDATTGAIKQTLALPARGDPKPGFSVVGLAVQGDRVYASDAQSQVRGATRGEDGKWRAAPGIDLAPAKVSGLPHPAGLALAPDGALWVAVTRDNSVQRLDPTAKKAVESVAVGVAPYALCFCGPDKCYVSNWGGDPPAAGAAQALSSGTPIRVDPKFGIANHGSVSVLDRAVGSWKQSKTIAVGLHPSGLAVSGGRRFLYVANANSDTVSVIDTRTDGVVETIACRPEARLPFGSGSNALALSPDGRTLYVANGTNNAIAVVRLGALALESARPGEAGTSSVLGLIPTGWYPGAIRVSPDGNKLYVANVKGHGSLSQPRATAKGKNSHDHLGSVSIIDVPDDAQLAKYTLEVNANNRLAYSLAGLDRPRPDAKPAVVPERHGEPSLIEHVIYVIKENRTYDQLLGDMQEGNGDPNLVLFGAEVTPNHHALARQFTLFDNFYCSGVLSADGHSWVNEAYVTDYLEKAFGGFTRSYPDDGSDPLAYPPSGFLWDNALAHKKTVFNFGEFVSVKYHPKDATWTAYYEDFRNGTATVPINVTANIASMAPYTHPHYPWFPLLVPDVYRAKMFIEELKTYETKGKLPNLVYVTLPCDHTTGTKPGYPTPRASVADNDLALGRIVEAVSKSKFWPKTCIFVVEDDPQNGFDHVDGHRTVAFAISPYTRRQFVDRTNYNQTGMVKTIELMLGLPPMNQLDLSATPLRHCFQPTPDLTPYSAVPNRSALDEMNPSLDKLQGQALSWAKKSLELDLDDGDAADDDALNRILWHAMHGAKRYPEEYVNEKD
jgi:YVTN family beta-propeller protein